MDPQWNRLGKGKQERDCLQNTWHIDRKSHRKGLDISQLRKPDHLGSQNGPRIRAYSTEVSQRRTASMNMKLIRYCLDIRRRNHTVMVRKDRMELLHLEMFLRNKLNNIIIRNTILYICIYLYRYRQKHEKKYVNLRIIRLHVVNAFPE